MTEAHARLHLDAATAAVTESKRLRSKDKQTLSPFQHLQCTLYSPMQIAACHRHLQLAQARPHDAVSICLV